MAQPKPKRTWRYAISMVLVFSLAVGYALGLAQDKNVTVDPEYLSAMITALSIALGFWFALFSIRDLRKTHKDFPFETVNGFLLILLTISVFLTVLTAYKILDAIYTLAVLSVSFLTVMFAIFVYFSAENSPS
jgi:UDP-N-acetylmuramyl pentapeptide phosphotransferase/UDP-N-acetylglucosamine-1-phosphate transferase